MRYLHCLLLVIVCCVVCSGCGSAKIQELTAEVESLKAKVAEMEAENAKLETELGDARQNLAHIEEIKKGYETARTKFKDNMKQLAPLLGSTESPLPPFEELKDSSWVGKFAPSAEMTSGIKGLEKEIKGLLGDQGVLPGSKPRN